MEWFHQLIGEARGEIGASEMIVRALIVFLYGIVITRIGGWRAFGKWSPPDIIVAIIVGANLSRAITGPTELVPALVATTVLFIAYWTISFAASRWPVVDWLFKGHAARLVKDGVLDRDAMRRSVVSPRDLEEAVRIKGLRDTGEVDAAFIERSGKISVIEGQ